MMLGYKTVLTRLVIARGTRHWWPIYTPTETMREKYWWTNSERIPSHSAAMIVPPWHYAACAPRELRQSPRSRAWPRGFYIHQCDSGTDARGSAIYGSRARR